MRKINFVIFIILNFLLTANCFAYTIIAIERGSVVYGLKNGKLILEKDKANYKIYYEVDEESGIIKRTKLIALNDIPIADCAKGDIIPDNTTYKILSSPDFLLQQSIIRGDRLIHAVGQPGAMATELLTIGKQHMMSSKSTGDYMVIVDYEIVDRSDIPGNN
mgnify:CR=1 FL=1